MANEQLKRLFRRGPEIDEAEFDMLQSRVQARLRPSGAERDRAAAEDAAHGDLDGSVAVGMADARSTDLELSDLAEAEAGVDALAGRARYMAIRATTYELPEDAVGVMAEANGSGWERPAADAALDEIADRVSPPSAEPVVRHVDGVETEVAQAPNVKVTRTKAAATKPSPAERRGRNAPTAPTPRTKPPTAKAGPARPPRRLPARPRPPVVRSVGLPYCPYCATLLDPPPEVNRRCPRCRCDWYLAIRDESLVRRHLRRRKRAEVTQPADGA